MVVEGDSPAPLRRIAGEVEGARQVDRHAPSWRRAVPGTGVAAVAAGGRSALEVHRQPAGGHVRAVADVPDVPVVRERFSLGIVGEAVQRSSGLTLPMSCPQRWVVEPWNMATTEGDRVHPDTVQEWRAWLDENHETSPGVWLVSWKKHTGRPTVGYEEAVTEALAVGWVDSKGKRLDDDRTMLYLTRRRPTSGWSRPNKERIERLYAEGRMGPAGQAAIDAQRRTAPGHCSTTSRTSSSPTTWAPSSTDTLALGTPGTGSRGR